MLAKGLRTADIYSAGTTKVGTKEMGAALGLKPRARIRSFASIGSEPSIMLTGPAYAAEKALKKAGMSVHDIDLFEVNEAFAAVPMRFAEVLGIDPARINVNGGAIAMGHPLGATGAIILGRSGCRSAYQTGRGSIMVRSRHTFEQRGERRSIVLTEIPYQQGKNALVEKIAEAAKEKRIEGISDIRDESNREGVRIVIEIKRDAAANVILSTLFKLTPLQTSYGINNVALSKGRPKILNLRDLISKAIQQKNRGAMLVNQFEHQGKKALQAVQQAICRNCNL